MTIRSLIIVCVTSSSVMAQQQLPPLDPATQLPPLDPSVQLGVCQQQRGRFLNEAEKASAYATQFLSEIADLKKKLADAEAKLLPRQ